MTADSVPPKPPNGNGGPHRTLHLGVTESDDSVEDAHLLREVVRVLLEYPGNDRINLEIHTAAGTVLLELPVVSTAFCDELQQRLITMLGAGSVRLQDGVGLNGNA